MVVCPKQALIICPKLQWMGMFHLSYLLTSLRVASVVKLVKNVFIFGLRTGRIMARLKINFYAPYNDQIPGLIHLSYAINPTDSRILR